MKVYIVTVVEHECGGHANESVIGAFSTKEEAVTCLDNTFHEKCDEYSVEELNEHSFQDETSFNIEEELSFEVFGNITELDIHHKYSRS